MGVARRKVRVVAFDLGSWFGWWVWELDLRSGALHRVESGVWNLNVGKHQSSGWRSIAAERYVNWLVEKHGPMVVSYEAVAAHTGTDAAHLYGAFLDTVKRVCDRARVPHKGYFPGTAKKAVTGNGGCSKEEVALALAGRLGLRESKARPYFGFRRDDESDAAAVGLAALVDLGYVEHGWATA